jgi:phosphate:Na+ symporter
MTAEQVDELFMLRAAGRDIVEAIKDTKHLQKNLGRSVITDNKYIRKEYDNIRKQLAAVLRELAKIRQRGDDSIAVLSLDSLKLSMKESDVLLTGALDKLIRKSLISPPMATSLINDSGYAYDIAKNLVKMGEVLFSSGDIATRAAERSLSLGEGEVNEVLQETQQLKVIDIETEKTV